MAFTATSKLRSLTSMSLGRVVDSMDSHTPRSDMGADSISDCGSPSDTIAVTAPTMATNKNIGMGGYSRRTSTVKEQQNMHATEAKEVNMSRREYERENSLEQQGLKRRRVEDQMSSLMIPILSSCETCKHRKVKCDRAQPSCLRCQRNKQECVYKQKKKPGLRAGIGRELEERLGRVESMLASHARILEAQAKTQQLSSPSRSTRSHHSSLISPLVPISYSGQGTSPVTNGAGTYIPQTQMPGPSHSQLGRDSLPAILGSPSASSTAAELYRDRTNSIAHMDVDGRVHAVSTTSGGIRASSSIKSFDPGLPPDDVLYHLIDLYFAQVQPGCPILHRQTLMDSYFNRPVSEQQLEDIILLYAICAAALRFSTDRRLDTEYKAQFRNNAKQKVIFNALENPSIQSLRAMIIIVLDVVGSTNGPSGWGLLALTTRMAVHLGLNTEPSNSPAFLMSGGGKELPSISTWGVGMLPEPKDWIEQEGRRRLFWIVYVLDIYTSLGTSLDLTIDENEIERLLPCLDELWDRNQAATTRWFRTPAHQADNSVSNINTLSSFSFLIEILGLLGRIHRFLRKPIDINNLSNVEIWQRKYRALDKALTSWKYSLPMQYGKLTRALNMGPSSNAVDPGWALLHAAYNTAVIRLHSVAAYPTNRSQLFGPSYSAGQRCLSAVENIAALTRIVIENNMLSQLGSTFAFTLWVSARLLLVHASTTNYQMIPDIRLFLDALHEMGRIYETAERYASILQRVLDELTSAVGEDGLNMMGKEAEGVEHSPKMGNHASGEGSTGDVSTPGSTSGATGDSKKQSCVAILAAMRRTAFAVDVLISRQPNANKPQSVAASYGADGYMNGHGGGHYKGAGALTPQPQGHHGIAPTTGVGNLTPLSPNPQMAAMSGPDQQQFMVMNNPHTFEYLDVFNFFNFPRVPVGTGVYLDGQVSSAGTPIQSFATSPAAAEQGAGDWLFRE